ncbi:anti-sigma factor family protein [Fimbriimonas ginsengisoli]|uniref:Uncharacterized protein n=1 Tax=Fimbriimonas ginsengisoli Gsoil 348 TaxID=661478 RepID=A0A068NWJ4_FIMGI|nr:hypothetical protein [Fimbriimonas ginsengisoli]AIE87737.1 hypothetical protein OP10G_4369 [Fimbriimonas ginsengisoli Gsoil 348]
MNGKFEEKLARLAFGDMSSEESSQVEAQIGSDPAARRALAEFRDMREGLRGLAEVPDHQLSNERLRDAILARGLRPEAKREEPKGLGAGWIWMPVAALSLGFGLMMLRPRANSGEPQVVLSPSSVASRNLGFDSNPMGSASSTMVAKNETAPKISAAPVAVTKKPEPLKPIFASNRRRRYHSPHFTSDAIPLRVDGWKDNNKEDGPVALVGNTSAPSRVPAAATNKPADPASASTPIVLIDMNPDASTGAPTATEVGTASNVLIGG